MRRTTMIFCRFFHQPQRSTKKLARSGPVVSGYLKLVKYLIVKDQHFILADFKPKVKHYTAKLLRYFKA
jgi:hypothetical protein